MTTLRETILAVDAYLTRLNELETIHPEDEEEDYFQIKGFAEGLEQAARPEGFGNVVGYYERCLEVLNKKYPPKVEACAIKSLTIIGKRWFQRGPANTYHTVEVIIDGLPVYNPPIVYGFGDHYEQTAFDWLKTCGLVDGITKPMRIWAEDEGRGIIYTSRVSDVTRERDL